MGLYLFDFDFIEIANLRRLAKAQPAQPPLRISPALPNAGGALEDKQGCCMNERRFKRKFDWTEQPAVLAEGLLRLHGAGVVRRSGSSFAVHSRRA